MKAFLWSLAVVPLLACGCAQDRTRMAGAPVEVTDDLDRVVRLPRPATRIVSLAPSLTETLFALGLDSAVVGVTSFCNFPPEAQERTIVGGMTNPSLERIISLNPDLVVLTVLGNNRTDFEKLLQLKLPVFVSNPTDVDGITRSIRNLSTLGDRRAEGKKLIDSLEARRGSLAARSRGYPTASLLVLVSVRPLIAAAQGTFLDQLVQLANGVNALPPSSVPFPLVGPEEVLRAQPGWILTTTDVAAGPDELTAALPQLRSLPALRQRRIVILDADLISRPGPRILLALEALVTRLESDNRLRSDPSGQ